jgi:hypothetical protein
MHGMTRGAATLIGVAVAGFLIWVGTTALPNDGEASSGEFWWAAGFIAAAGLTMALSQLLGGWTKWGWPRLSVNVFLFGFLPALIAGGWIVAAGEPGDHWLGGHARDWSNDIGLESFVRDMAMVWPALAFGVGLAFGLTFDTTGPKVAGAEPRKAVRWRRRRRTEAKPPAETPGRETTNGEPSERPTRIPETAEREK